ncbi:putative palmitoyltransferase ZDHHC24 isoform X2 [Pontoporia blainvillei]|uniref:Palmitoyltransferase n=1 Tax=Pontoporia blainvillei TaxID=48723 RepID=A0ABX0S1I9_PONBL|nr:putative palmitoyltransferase ZDHHC24 isoform X2 [Pontoporia blainvillei]
MLAGRGLGQGWAYCYQCQSRRPPRSGHCSAWRRCILRRDHHGHPRGGRVRFRNYRPCVCLLLHAAGVLLHVCALPGPDPSALLQAHTPLHPPPSSRCPGGAGCSQAVSPAPFALAFVTDTCVACAPLCAAGLLFRGMLLLRGQTTWEWARGGTLTTWTPPAACRRSWGPAGSLSGSGPSWPPRCQGDGITFQTTADVGLMAS